MAKLLRHLYGVVQRVFEVSLCWTKGHDGDLGNVLADTLANEGCAAELPTDRDFMPSEWNAEEFANTLTESDFSQEIPSHELLGAHVKRIGTTKKKRSRKTVHNSTCEGTAASPFLHAWRSHFGGVRSWSQVRQTTRGQECENTA